MTEATSANRVRLDKFLWAARFFKTRQLASLEIDKGRVQVNGHNAKPGREVHVGDELRVRQGPVERTVIVQALSGVRGPAPVAQALYQETPQSIAMRERLREQQRLSPEPALSQTQGRPTKRDRRDLERAYSPKDWNDRWSASVDD